MIKDLLSRAENGDMRAQNELGDCYYKGEGVERNYKEAVKWYTEASKQGNNVAQINLGSCYCERKGVKRHCPAAIKWYTKAAKQGYAEAQNKLGDCCYCNEENYEKGIKWYTKAAEQGYKYAQNNLGDCYYYGQGVKQNFEEAVNWYIKAAEQGFEYAQDSLGNCYYNGEGVEQDFEEAAKWYTKAAEQGYKYAQNSLGDCYYDGEGVEQDFEEAVKWYTKAAEQGYAVAQNNLGDCYYYGEGVEKNYEEAVKWYTEAAKQADKKAKDMLLKLPGVKANNDNKNMLNEKNYVFISYSSKNQSMADATRMLLKEYSITCWMAPYDIPAGSKYAYVINDALENCSCLLLLLTNDSQNSQFVEKEVERAVAYKKSIITMQLEKVVLNSGFKFYIGNEQIVAVHNIDKNNSEMQRIINGIKVFVSIEEKL